MATDVGRRRDGNEDRLLASGWTWPGMDGAWLHSLNAARGFAAVADGMGGHQAGELASATVAASLSAALPSITSEADLDRMLRQANDSVFEAMYSPAGRPGMGSTVAGIALVGSHALVFNVGDSRTYLKRGARLVQISVDDTPPRASGSAAWRSHALTQSLGGSVRRTSLTPHIRRIAIEPIDELLVCTDGLTDMLADEEILDILSRRHDNPAAALAAVAIDAGGHDNVSIIVIGGAAD